MPEVLIGLQHHGARGWTWAVHHPGQVSVWRTNEAGCGMQRQVPTGGVDAHRRPVYDWKTLEDTANFALPGDRAAVLARLRTTFVHHPMSPARPTSNPRELTNTTVLVSR